MAQKKRKANIDNNADPFLLTDEDWSRMMPYRKILISEDNEEGESIVQEFAVGNCVSILPQTSELPEGYGVEDGPALPLNLMWLGVVKGIRMRAIDGVDEGFAKIQWFYSKSDARNVVQSFDLAHIGKNERILSDHHDYVHSSALDDVVPIKRFRFDPTYEDTPTACPAGEQTLRQVFDQPEIRTGNNGSVGGNNIFYRYDLEVKKRLFSPKVSQYNCFSSKSTYLYHNLPLGNLPPRSRPSRLSRSKRPVNATVPRQDHRSCFLESSYSPPDSERALDTARQVALLVCEVKDTLEVGVKRVELVCAERSGPKPSTNGKGPSSRSRAGRPRSLLSAPSLPNKRSRTGNTTFYSSEISEFKSSLTTITDVDVLIHNTQKQLLQTMQRAVLLEDTLVMHICPKSHCTAPRGRAWHRSCLLRDNVESDISIDDVEGNVDIEMSQSLGRCIPGNAHHRDRATINHSPPTFQHVLALWKQMSRSQQQHTERSLSLLCSVPQGYERDGSMSNGEGEYEFPIIDADQPIPASDRNRRQSTSQSSGQDELDVVVDLIPDQGLSVGPGRKSSPVTAISQDALNAVSPRKRGRLSNADNMDSSDPPHSQTPLPRKTVEANMADDDSIPQIMYSLSLLLAPEIICLASQPMIRGGVPPIPSSSSLPSDFPALARTSPIFSADSSFGKALQTTITGNVSQVTRARIAVYKALDKLLQAREDIEDPESGPLDQALVVPTNWADYIVEVEGREWLFKLSYYPTPTTAPQRESRNLLRKCNTSTSLSKSEIRKTIIDGTMKLMHHWQLARRNIEICPNCRSCI